MSNNKIIIFVVTVILVLTITAGVYYFIPKNNVEPAPDNGIVDQNKITSGTVEITISDTQSTVYFVEYEIGDTVYEVISKLALESDDFDIKFDEFMFGDSISYFVTEINGVQPAENQFWKLYVNDIESQTGVSEYFLAPEDNIKLKLENFE
jgi:hypothetical protein